MMKPVYILSGCAISPQHSYEPAEFLKEIVASNNGQLHVIDPDYRQYINPVAIRRMGRQLKMGITAGMRALQLANVQTPHAIITGTGLGSMTDTEHFLNDMITLDEAALNPTYFIQSTYNSVNGWLAVQSKATGYNQTYVNRGLSIEMALLDAQMLLNETSEEKYVLAGGFDEMTSEYHLVKSKVGYWKEEAIQTDELYGHSNTPGTIAGEGTAFFVLSNRRENAPRLCSIKMVQSAESADLNHEVQSLLSSLNLTLEDIDTIISGHDGDSRHDAIYETLEKSCIESTAIIRYKHWTGEYPTSPGFALWLAVQALSGLAIPVWKKGSKPVKRILILNYYLLGTVGMMVIEK